MYENDKILGENIENDYDFYGDTMKRIEKQEKIPKNIEFPNLFEIYKGKVCGIKEFGIFVKLRDFPNVSTLVPRRLIANYEISNTDATNDTENVSKKSAKI